jgi:hypothetical protein
MSQVYKYSHDITAYDLLHAFFEFTDASFRDMQDGNVSYAKYREHAEAYHLANRIFDDMIKKMKADTVSQG